MFELVEAVFDGIQIVLIRQDVKSTMTKFSFVATFFFIALSFYDLLKINTIFDKIKSQFQKAKCDKAARNKEYSFNNSLTRK